jgi:Putative DNA-binding domain
MWHMASLPELQSSFAAALRGDPEALTNHVSSGGIDADGRIGIYRNNARAMFEQALERTYPVLRRRVGDEYFRQLARGYRARHPSRSGDLHWIGEHFPGYVAETETGTGYEWLAELAALEWACETALVARQEPAVGPETLSLLHPQQLGATRLSLQPSLRCVSSAFPVLDVWRANQPGADGGPIDLERGAQCIAVSCSADGLDLREVSPAVLEFLRLLQCGERLGEAVDRSRIPIDSLPDALALLFQAGLVTAVLPAAAEIDQ